MTHKPSIDSTAKRIEECGGEKVHSLKCLIQNFPPPSPLSLKGNLLEQSKYWTGVGPVTAAGSSTTEGFICRALAKFPTDREALKYEPRSQFIRKQILHIN